jgi:hypothetical protein
VTAARALRSLLAVVGTEVAGQALVEEFPWMELLPAQARAAFVRDFVRAAQASAELGHWSVLAQTLVEWRATAAVYADPALVAQLSEPLSADFGPVPEPTGD